MQTNSKQWEQSSWLGSVGKIPIHFDTSILQNAVIYSVYGRGTNLKWAFRIFGQLHAVSHRVYRYIHVSHKG